jgi:tRNA (mo5U34)-methyltransferase
MTAPNVTSLEAEIEALGPWFHNLTLPDGRQTAPNHHFGDFPRFKWDQIAPHIPADLSGLRVLDIGCNAGFYSFRLAERGAFVTGIDVDDHYLRQARWASKRFGLSDRVLFRRGSVYEMAALEETFDIVVFMGVFYHLRYPLLALDGLATLRPRLMIFQSLTYGDPQAVVQTDGARFQDRSRLEDAGWPKLAFIETEFSGDPTNWWVPNRAGILALLRAAGFRVDSEPGDEIFLCSHDPAIRRGYWDETEFTLARGAAGKA